MESTTGPEARLPIVVKTVDDANEALKSRADLSYRLFDGLELHGNVARQSLFPGALFRNCTIRDCDFSRSDFEGTRFEKCDLRNVSFEDADVRSTRFADCQLTECTFVGSYFSRNTITGGTLESCHFDRATLLNNEFQNCELRNISNQVSTILHTDFVQVTFSGVSLGNCTSLYCYFERCDFRSFEINADSVGLSFGLPESALNSTKLVFLGRAEQTPPSEPVVDSLLKEFTSRGWSLHERLTELNFGRVPPVTAWLRLFEFFQTEAEQLRVIKSDDVAFVLHIALKLAQGRALPLFSAITAYDKIARAEAQLANDSLALGSLSDIRIGLSNILTLMETEFLDGARDVAAVPMSERVTAEFTFVEKPAISLAGYLDEISSAALMDHLPAVLIGTRPGSWIETLETTVASMLAVYAMLYLVEGYLVRLTMIRARLKHLVSSKLPKAYLDRAIDPAQDPSRELLEVLAATYSALLKGTISLPGKDAGITGRNLTEIRTDYPKSPS